ncbi:hypothetical protein G6F57_021237 [Rhizopus arrhizus]|nr:hypothetical protein G6F57_021237 [Rhizopus arrhizus]
MMAVRSCRACACVKARAGAGASSSAETTGEADTPSRSSAESSRLRFGCSMTVTDGRQPVTRHQDRRDVAWSFSDVLHGQVEFAAACCLIDSQHCLALYMPLFATAVAVTLCQDAHEHTHA